MERDDRIPPCNRRWSDESSRWEVYGGGGVWLMLWDCDDPDSPPINYNDAHELSVSPEDT